MTKEFEVITFKADRDLLEAMQGIPNRSAFIRQAILGALQNVCPLCNGSGVLTPSQQSHWHEFSADHHLVKCRDCSEMHLVCEASCEASCESSTLASGNNPSADPHTTD